MANQYAEAQQHQRDLRAQIADLNQSDAPSGEMQFIEWSPGRKIQRLWSMIDGQEINIPQYMVMGAITKRLPDGRFAFTARQEEAPVFKPGNVRCFLADDSPERESGLLAEAGLDHLPACSMKELRSTYSKRVHAQNRHKQSWETLQEHRAEQEREHARAEQTKQTEAMLQLAGSQADRGTRGRSG